MNTSRGRPSPVLGSDGMAPSATSRDLGANGAHASLAAVTRPTLTGLGVVLKWNADGVKALSRGDQNPAHT